MAPPLESVDGAAAWSGVLPSGESKTPYRCADGALRWPDEPFRAAVRARDSARQGHADDGAA